MGSIESSSTISRTTRFDQKNPCPEPRVESSSVETISKTRRSTFFQNMKVQLKNSFSQPNTDGGKRGGGANPVIRKRGTKPNSPIEVEAARHWRPAERRPPGPNCRNEQPMRNFLEDADRFFFSKGKFVSARRLWRPRFSVRLDPGESDRTRISALPWLVCPEISIEKKDRAKIFDTPSSHLHTNTFPVFVFMLSET